METRSSLGRFPGLLRYCDRRLREKALRIDVDFELERAFGLGRVGHPLPQVSREVIGARRLHQNPETMAPAHHGERRLGGSEHAHVVVDGRDRCDPARKSFGLVLVGARHQQAREPAERRIAGLLAHLDLGRVERVAVLRDQRAHHRMLGLVRLQEAVAAALPRRPARPTT